MQSSAAASGVGLRHMASDMFCFQCEQTNEGTGCTTVGVCGKEPSTAALQDLLMASLKRLGFYYHGARSHAGIHLKEIDRFIMEASFSTLTNVNFDNDRMTHYITQSEQYVKQIMPVCPAEDKVGLAAGLKTLDLPASMEGRIALGKKFGVLDRRSLLGEDVAGLQELLTYGFKGTAAYAYHASAMGHEKEAIFEGLTKSLRQLAATEQSVDALVGAAMEMGGLNLQTMGLLDAAHRSELGVPVPSQVNTSPVHGKCILVSGHDLHDLKDLLDQCVGTGVNVYTHGEMLPAHSYPELRKYRPLVGHYGGAWQLQKIEFAHFPGPIIMTSNCVVEPRKKYADRIWSKNAVGFPGMHHLPGNDYSGIIAQAQSMTGWEKDEPEKWITTGFGREAVLGAAPLVLDLIGKGKLKDVFLIGGCDGSEGERSYFTEVAKNAPHESLILTLGCGKFRMNSLDLGNIEGLPRLLDMGQCNDAFGAVQVAVGLAAALKTDVHSLPLHFVVSWFEQKAVAVLLTLLHLGIQDIRLGPALPAFVSPNVLAVLQDQFKIKAIGDPKEDLKQMLAGH